MSTSDPEVFPGIPASVMREMLAKPLERALLACGGFVPEPETCLAGIVQPFSDSHVCLCLSVEHDGATPHQCDECGSRWAG